MPHLFERTALILLAGTALTACASTPPGQPPRVQLPPAASSPPQALAEAPSAEPAEVVLLDLPPAAATVAAPAVAEAIAEAEGAVVAPGEDAFQRSRSRGPAATYTVRRGDTLAEIANRLGTEIDDLARLNGLKRPYRLQPGQVLKNPKAPKAAATSRASRASAGASTSGGTYTVRRGDTLFAIAQRNGTTVEALRRANGMGRNASLIPGRKLKLPGGAEAEERAEAPDEDAALAERMANAAARRDQPQADEPEPPARPGERVVTDRQVTGRVVTIDIPGRSYKVRKGDNLERVANRLDSNVAELARINKLKRPYRLQPGQTIRGPGTKARAYVVGRGDTISEIARRFSVTEAELRSANGLRRGASVAPGRRLRLPPGYRDRGPLTTTTRVPETPVTQPPPPTVAEPPPAQRPRPPVVTLPGAPQPYRPPTTAPGTTPYPRTGPVPGAPVASPPVSDAQISEMGRGLFVWPLQGQVISGFGGRGQGPRNDGLNIRANAGDAVRAAASGDVVYAGDQVPGFGNLVLIKHADGWVTAYGHLSRVDVRMQQKVTQGQQIGQAGTSGGVSEPQLHFEVRYAPTPQERARPVDPALVLPK
ncbi:LysM peptidoglycan-binding domain-containing protein [Phenylobacterium sp.]|uniref:LysM peptidoglycan-binding domain-containing protein n=1 Tax=Phenylobacterium sp. TaxID=1871053 RepID=UPI002EDA92EC